MNLGEVGLILYKKFVSGVIVMLLITFKISCA